jgi:hypothetical protein
MDEIVTEIPLKTLIKSCCELIYKDGKYIKAEQVKTEMLMHFGKSVSRSYVNEVLSKLNDLGFLKCESEANFSNEKLYGIRRK